MTAARLSPAATLLRNSKLFALPPTLSLPPTEVSSDYVSVSDTATTPYPIRAAIETPTTSLNRGDWGLKRPLPTKTTTKSGTPVIRIQGGIDTREHIADFESAADHVLTLRKWQELNLKINMPGGSRSNRFEDTKGVFHSEVDHTTDSAPPADARGKKVPETWPHVSPVQREAQMPPHLRQALEELRKARSAESPSEGSIPQEVPSPATPSLETQRRWRYAGPYLAGMNGMQFEAFLKKVGRKEREAFRAKITTFMATEREERRRADALDAGEPVEERTTVPEITDQEVMEYLRELRSNPGKFGPLITEFFDLADGPREMNGPDEPWLYGRDTIAADSYKQTGPPRTHPSAGLSYIQSKRFSVNDVAIGPRDEQKPVPGRLLKVQFSMNRAQPMYGMAGVVAAPPPVIGTSVRSVTWEPVKNGPKAVLTPRRVSISHEGRIDLTASHAAEWHLDENDKPVLNQERREAESANQQQQASSRIPQTVKVEPLDEAFGRGRARPKTAATKADEDISEALGIMMTAARKTAARKAAADRSQSQSQSQSQSRSRSRSQKRSST